MVINGNNGDNNRKNESTFLWSIQAGISHERSYYEWAQLGTFRVVVTVEQTRESKWVIV